MDDRFLQDQRRDPDPAFASRLRARLRAIEADERPRTAPRTSALLAAAAVLVAVVALFVSPGLRLRAQAMLDLFRVREFAIVQVDEQRLQQLKDRNFDPGKLFIGDHHEIEHAPPQFFTSVGAASAAAGFTPAQPATLPRGMALDTVVVHEGGRASGRVDTQALRGLMDAFDVRDLSLPAGLDQPFSVEMPTMLAQQFHDGSRSNHVVLLQGASPEVTLPHGVDMARLGEIGLRLIGLQRDEAHRMAGSIDWRSTLVVPVFASATSFQQVTVNGDKGVYVEMGGSGGMPRDHHEGRGAALLWTHAGRVYGLMGSLNRFELMEMAESVR
jgi:hypothetical protein